MRSMGRRGGSAAEFALVLPMLLLISFGIIEFGLVLYDQAMITNASREGARRGIVFSDPRPTDTDIIGTVNTYCSNHLISFSGTRPTPAVTVTRAGNNPGDSLTVTVTYPYSFLVFPNVQAWFGGGVPSPLVLNAVTVMRLE